MEENCIEFDEFARMMSTSRSAASPTGDGGERHKSGLKRLIENPAFLSQTSISSDGHLSFRLQVGRSSPPVKMLVDEAGTWLAVCFGHCSFASSAASINDHGEVELIDYAVRRPSSYPRSGSVLSSGTSTMRFLQALSVLMGVENLHLTDASYVPKCLFPLAFARMAVGQPTWYESLGFVIKNAKAHERRDSYACYLQSRPEVVSACEVMFDQRFEAPPSLYDAVNYLSHRDDIHIMAVRFGSIQYSMRNPGQGFLADFKRHYL